ncbi:MAG TPA: CNNM domain-containing protein [Burkholderiales bacterium]|nr:CNNM domain-containing protein [Burkholderiales bacterium]
MTHIHLSVLLSTLVLLLILSGFFAASETSLMALNRYRLRHLVKTGEKGARRATFLLSRTDKLLGVLSLGNNLLNAAAAALVTIICVSLLGNNKWALTLGTLIVTFAILVFSEITPKVLGATYTEPIAFFASAILIPMLRICYPIVWFVNLFVSGLLRIIGLTPKLNPKNIRLGMAELRTLVMESGPFIPKHHQKILVNLFELEKTTVDDIMTPRGQIESVDIEGDFEMLSEQLSTSNHTKIVIHSGGLDSLIGIVRMRDVLHLMRIGNFNRDTLKQITQPPYFIPEGTPLLSQLQMFQENQEQLGLVVDEYGDLLGLLTLEDILEEIVGEFSAGNATALGARKLADGSYLAGGSILIKDLNRKLGMQLPTKGPRTLNGLILEHFQDIPETGVTFKINGHTIEIIHVHDHQVRTAKVTPPTDPEHPLS